MLKESGSSRLGSRRNERFSIGSGRNLEVILVKIPNLVLEDMEVLECTSEEAVK